MIQCLLDPLKLDFDFSPVSQVDTRIINKQQFLSIKQLIKFILWVFDLDLEFKILPLEFNHESSISYLSILHLNSLPHFRQFGLFDYFNVLLMYKLKFKYLMVRGSSGYNYLGDHHFPQCCICKYFSCFFFEILFVKAYFIWTEENNHNVGTWKGAMFKWGDV